MSLNLKSTKAHTLVELLVATGITGLISLIIAGVIKSQYDNFMMMKKYQNMDLIARNIRKTIEDPRTIVDSAKRDSALAACLNESGSCTVTIQR